MQIDLDKESMLYLYVALHEILRDYVETISNSSFDYLQSLCDVIGEKLLSSLESECDKIG